MDNQIIPTHINIYGNKKIGNPYHKGTTNKYYGDVVNYGFDTNSQKRSYLNIINKFDESNVDIRFDKIYASTIVRHTRIPGKIHYGTTFIVTTNNKNVYWYKYESAAEGSGNNVMLINGKKINVTEFLKMTPEAICNLINTVPCDN